MKEKETKALEIEEEVKAEAIAEEPKKKIVKADVPKVTPKPKDKNVVYLGPVIEGIGKSGTIYKDGILPSKAQECIKAYAPFSRLFVDTSVMGDALKELRSGKGALCEIYKVAIKKFKGGK